MDEIDRRSVLQAAAVGAVGLAGAAGLSSAVGSSGNGPPSSSGSDTQGSSSSPSGRIRDCQAGSTFVAKYEADGCTLEFAEGDDVMTFSNLVCQDDELVGFDWTSTEPIAEATVKYGTSLSEFEGGFTGTVDLSAATNSISHVTFCGPTDGRAILCEVDMTEAYDIETHIVDSGACTSTPSSGDTAVEVTSLGPTTDYAHGMVNVLQRVGELSLGDLTTLEYAFARGAGHDHAAPDEAFVTFLTDKGTPDEAINLAATTVDAAGSGCQTVDLLSEFGQARWLVLEDVSVMEITSETVTDLAVQLRESGPDTALTSFANTTLLGVGFGAGNTTTPATTDLVVDDLVVGSSTSSTTLEFPGVVPMDLSFSRRGGTLTAELSFQQSEPGLGLQAIDPSSIELNAFRTVTPPPERGLLARRVRVDGSTLHVEFNANQAEDVIGDGKAIVSGDFDLTDGHLGSSFFGTDTPFG